MPVVRLSCQGGDGVLRQRLPQLTHRLRGRIPRGVPQRAFRRHAGKALTGEFVLNGVSFICLDGGPAFQLSEAISFTVACQDQGEIDYYWKALSHVPDFEQCGWRKDRLGLS